MIIIVVEHSTIIIVQGWLYANRFDHIRLGTLARINKSLAVDY